MQSDNEMLFMTQSNDNLDSRQPQNRVAALRGRLPDRQFRKIGCEIVGAWAYELTVGLGLDPTDLWVWVVDGAPAVLMPPVDRETFVSTDPMCSEWNLANMCFPRVVSILGNDGNVGWKISNPDEQLHWQEWCSIVTRKDKRAMAENSEPELSRQSLSIN